MDQYTVAVVVGSLRKDSLNGRLAGGLAHLAPPEFVFKRVELRDLPMYNQDDDGNDGPAVKRLKGEIKAAKALLFVTPEYNRSIPGVLKNALDIASRPYGQSLWAGKPAGVIGLSVGAIGTALAQQHLRSILSFLDVSTMGQPEIYLQYREGMFAADGNIGPDSRPLLQTWMERYVAWVKRHART